MNRWGVCMMRKPGCFGFRLPEFEARRVHNVDVATSSWPRQKSVAIKRSEDAPARTCKSQFNDRVFESSMDNSA